jgi:hypothetical protein
LSGQSKVSLPDVPANRSFSPNVINVKIRDIVTWTNHDVTPHTVTSGTGPSDPNRGKEFNSGLSTPLMPGRSFSGRSPLLPTIIAAFTAPIDVPATIS